MKRLLFSLLLLPFLGFSQVSISNFGSSATAVDNTVVSIGSASYSGGNMYVFYIWTTVAELNPTDNPTVAFGTDPAAVFDKRATVTGTNSRLIVYTFQPPANVTTTITLTYAELQTNTVYFAFACSSSGGRFNILEILTQSETTSADPSFTFASNPTMSYIGGFINNTNPFGGTAEASWTEVFDSGLATPMGYYGVSRNNTSDNTLVVTKASSTWMGIGLALRNTARAKIID